MLNLPCEMANVLLVEPKADTRAQMKEALSSLSFKNVTDTGNMKGVRDAFRDMDVHLIVAETALPEGDLGELIRKVRHQEIGDSPFVIAVAVISRLERANAAIDAGNDDILLRPFTEQKLQERILHLIKSRKKFVVTTDYIGPDRCGRPIAGGSPIPSIDVPNPLQMDFKSRTGIMEARRALKSALSVVNKHKVERHVFQINWLTERIVPKLMDKQDNSTDDLLGKLYWVSRDLARRIARTDYIYATYLSQTLVNMVEEIIHFPEIVDEREEELLVKLVRAMVNFCLPGHGAVVSKEQEKVDALMNNPAIGACSSGAGGGGGAVDLLNELRPC